MSQVDYEFKDRNLEFLNQPDFYIPPIIKIHLSKPSRKTIDSINQNHLSKRISRS